MMSTVLVVDDEILFRESLRLALERAGYEVREAENGRRGLALYREKPADLVITGLGMPEMTGLDMMAAMHRDFGLVTTFVISGRGESELQKARTMGAQAVWRKPFNFDEFLSAVEQEMRSKARDHSSL